MEDLFYFTRSRVTLECIERLAAEAGYRYHVHSEGGLPHLRIYFGGVFTRHSAAEGIALAPDFWDWSEWDDYECLEEPAQERLRAYRPVSSFIIGYHTHSLSMLVAFLRQVLRRHGGWVGCDDDWTRVYDEQTIEAILSP